MNLALIRGFAVPNRSKNVQKLSKNGVKTTKSVILRYDVTKALKLPQMLYNLEIYFEQDIYKFGVPYRAKKGQRCGKNGVIYMGTPISLITLNETQRDKTSTGYPNRQDKHALTEEQILEVDVKGDWTFEPRNRKFILMNEKEISYHFKQKKKLTKSISIPGGFCEFYPIFPLFYDIFGPVWHPKPPYKDKNQISFLFEIYFKVIKHLGKFQCLSDIISQNNCDFVVFTPFSLYSWTFLDLFGTPTPI